MIGVAENMKDKGDYQEVENGMFVAIDTGWMRNAGNILIHVNPMPMQLLKAGYQRHFPTPSAQALRSNTLIKAAKQNLLMLVPLIIALIVAGFLIINVALVYMGCCGTTSTNEKAEIGLVEGCWRFRRRCVKTTGWRSAGACDHRTYNRYVFAVQFPLLNVFDLPAGVYITALLLAVLFIYLLVLFCALYPGRQAAAIYPAVALHEE